MKLFTFVILILLFASNTYAAAIRIKGVHPNCSNIRYLSTTYEVYKPHYKNAYEASYGVIAKEAFLYAQMASNAYEDYDPDKPEFPFVKYGYAKVGEKVTTWKGLGAHIYEKKNENENENEKNGEIVVAFEGTNFWSPADWLFGNLNLFTEGQYGEAKDLMRDIIKNNLDHKRIVVTGHSLGGALAISVALSFPNITAYTFNTSTTIHADKGADASGSELIVISENEDVLKTLDEKFLKFKHAYKRGPFNEFNFLEEPGIEDLPFGKWIKQIIEHGIYFIARGLTVYAAANDSADARQSLIDIREASSDNYDDGHQSQLQDSVCSWRH